MYKSMNEQNHLDILISYQHQCLIQLCNGTNPILLFYCTGMNAETPRGTIAARGNGKPPDLFLQLQLREQGLKDKMETYEKKT
jgi:hypothetical protein